MDISISQGTSSSEKPLIWVTLARLSLGSNMPLTFSMCLCVCAHAHVVRDVGWVEQVQETSRCYGFGGLFHPAKTAAA